MFLFGLCRMVARWPNTCDCFSCQFADPYPKEEVPMQKTLTCTCHARFVICDNIDHESDCDLWLIDEFWAGWLAWDTDREILVRTEMYPPGQTDPYTAGPDDDLPYADDAEWDEQDLVQAKLSEMELRDRDIALTTDMFIDRMMQKLPEDDEDSWVKDNTGKWIKTPTRPVTQHPYNKYTDYDYDYDYDYLSKYQSDRHCETKIHFANGVTVQATSLSQDRLRKGDTPDFAIYLDSGWRSDGMCIMLPWRDFGLPTVGYNMVRYAIQEAYDWAEAGAIVEVGCIGAHGRTGTVLACLAVLSDAELSPTDAIKFIRTSFCSHAIETRDQEWFVAWFHAQIHNIPSPPKPAYVPPAPKITQTYAPKAQAPTGPSHSAGPSTDPDPAKPGRTRRARRSKRGGRRNRNRSNTT